jgi:hypothetical protein
VSAGSPVGHLISPELAGKDVMIHHLPTGEVQHLLIDSIGFARNTPIPDFTIHAHLKHPQSMVSMPSARASLRLHIHSRLNQCQLHDDCCHNIAVSQQTSSTPCPSSNSHTVVPTVQTLQPQPGGNLEAHPSCNQARQGTTIHARVLYILATKNTSLSVFLRSEPSLGASQHGSAAAHQELK